MAMHYPPQPYYLIAPPQWPEDVKPALTEDDDSSVLDDQVFESSTPAEMTTADAADSRRPSITKLEDDYPSATHVWQQRPHNAMSPVRHYSQPSISFSPPQGQFFTQVNGAGAAFLPTQQSWPLSARSDVSTPTPFFGAVQDTFGQQGQYPGGPVFAGYPTQEPVSAVSMSPQSSQGGWASTTSSDVAESGPSLRHPRYRPSSPTMVLRSDGIRKKNAKFEIPKERNLQTIDALIMQSTNEEEKKELKQQKRLLRNRQAALDSRLRKKQNAEKLEADKKLLTSQKSDLEETVSQLETSFNHEREQWMHQQQQLEHYIQQLRYERDEAIRTKTVETGELRRMNNLLKDRVRDLERQNGARSYATNASDGFSNDFTNFRALDLEDSWDDEFSLINSDELKMDETESLQRQATPRPTTSSNQPSASTSATKSLDVKINAAFSWETFYMCLLSGAFIMSQAGSKPASAASSAAVVTSNMPTMSDEYRAEAGNVLQAVLASGPDGAHEVLPSRPAPGVDNDFGSTLPDADFARMGPGPHTSESTLDSLHTSLTTPSRHQQDIAAFSLSAASYNHIANADGVFDNDDDHVDVKPTRLQQLFSVMQAERDGIEKRSGFGSKARERSILLDRVPEKVLRDFREMIAGVE